MTTSETSNLTQGTRIVRAEASLCELAVERERLDAIQAFEKQETVLVEIETAAGTVGTGYAYTIGTGGRAILEHLRTDLLPALMGQDSSRIEAVWTRLYTATHATTVGPITSLAVAAIDIALWDIRCLQADLPLWVAAGGSTDRVELYDTESGWLQLDEDELVRGAIEARARGWRGFKMKVGKPTLGEDVQRVTAVREAVGPDMEIMVDANQSMTVATATRLARLLEPLDPAWLEEPLPADDLSGHVRLAASTSIPIAVGESLYSLRQFREYLAAGAASIVQVDAARVGGITPWLKTAHLAEAFNAQVAPHFLMELHVSLAGAVPNGIYAEHVPQLRAITSSPVRFEDGTAVASPVSGIGIDWDRDAIDRLRVA